MSGVERRRSVRHVARLHGLVRARVRPGLDVRLLDISEDGALIESGGRLLPGSSLEIHLTTKGERTIARARVLRCSVARLGASGLWYQAAVGFDRRLVGFSRGAECGGHLADQRPRVFK